MSKTNVKVQGLNKNSEKTEENKHGAVIAGCNAESEHYLDQKSKFKVDPVPFKFQSASTIRCKINRILKLHSPHEIISTVCDFPLKIIGKCFQ